ncbi:MAG: TatD family hydrolase [Candidatus Eremiobacteraeota bacterium]|nr:TatD family hydrolase [Candidatus Eremiobacteraeota bacterium]
MFDTHAHVHAAAFDEDREVVLQRARDAGVTRIMTIGTDVADSARARESAAAYGLEYAVGIHPHEAKDAPDDIAAALDGIVAGSKHGPRAVGEMGLDYYYAHSPRDAQERVLIAQMRYARERGLPAVFHQRDAFPDFIDVVQREGRGLRAVVHCFTGDAEQARRLTGEFGFMLGIGGVLTFKNAEPLRAAVAAVGLEALVLETDAPYLAPVPHRGRRNEPSFVAATATRLAALLETSLHQVTARTDATACALFGA